MLDLEAALEKILAALPASTPELVSLNEASGRILAEDLSAPIDLPGFDNSSMDGYAVRSEDTATARSDQPVRLRLAGKVPAGQQLSGRIAAGECVRIFTGSPLPAGADAVVMQEETRVEINHPGEILILEAARPWDNVRFRGEDLKNGARIAKAGDELNAGRSGLFAAMGIGQLNVGRRPVVGLLATGSELKEPGEPLGPGQIYESNRAALAPLVRSAGGLVKILPIVRDDPIATSTALQRAFAECDAVVTCGGVSVGEMDFVKSAFEQLGGKLEFWKVAIKPGRPFVFGRLGKKHLFGLPGNPVSAFVTFLLLVRPALLRYQGATTVSLPLHPGTAAEPLANPGNRRHFMRVTVDAAGDVHPSGIQASHILTSLAASNGLVDVPPKTTFPKGATVPVLRW